MTAKFKSFSFYLLSLSSYRNQGACYLERLCQRKNKVTVFYRLCVFGWRLDQTYSFSMRLAEASADKKGVTKRTQFLKPDFRVLPGIMIAEQRF